MMFEQLVDEFNKKMHKYTLLSNTHGPLINIGPIKSIRQKRNLIRFDRNFCFQLSSKKNESRITLERS